MIVLVKLLVSLALVIARYLTTLVLFGMCPVPMEPVNVGTVMVLSAVMRTGTVLLF